MSNYRYISDRQINNTSVIKIEEEYLCGNMLAELLRFEIAEIVDLHAPENLIIDFSNVKAISSSVIGTLLSIRTRLRRTGSTLGLCRVPGVIQDVYRTLNLHGNILQCFDTLEDAMDNALDSRQITLAPQAAMKLED